MENNLYMNILRKNTNKDIEIKKHQNKVIPRTVEMKKSPRREIIEKQKNKCFLCGSNFGNKMINFSVIESPNPEKNQTNQTTRQLRALCQDCYLKSKKF